MERYTLPRPLKVTLMTSGGHPEVSKPGQSSSTHYSMETLWILSFVHWFSTNCPLHDIYHLLSDYQLCDNFGNIPYGKEVLLVIFLICNLDSFPALGINFLLNVECSIIIKDSHRQDSTRTHHLLSSTFPSVCDILKPTFFTSIIGNKRKCNVWSVRIWNFLSEILCLDSPLNFSSLF